MMNNRSQEETAVEIDHLRVSDDEWREGGRVGGWEADPEVIDGRLMCFQLSDSGALCRLLCAVVDFGPEAEA